MNNKHLHLNVRVVGDLCPHATQRLPPGLTKAARAGAAGTAPMKASSKDIWPKGDLA